MKRLILSHFIVVLGKIWAKTGIAPGWLYECLERWGGSSLVGLRRRKLWNGTWFECDLTDHVQRIIYFFGVYEPIELSLFLELVTPGQTIVDAGANVGFYTLALAKKSGSQGNVIAFEPIEKNRTRLLRELQLNSLPSVQNIAPVEVVPVALWHRAETLSFSMPSHQKQNAGAYTAAPQSIVASGVAADVASEQVDAVSLDAWWANRGQIAAMKIDVEGAEKFLLHGASEVLRVHQPVVLLEVCRETCERFGYPAEELWAPFQALNYRAFRIGGTRLESEWVPDFKSIYQSNVLLVPPRLNQWQPNWNDRSLRRLYL